MSHPAFTSFKSMITTAFGGDYKVFELDKGSHFALGEIDLYLRIKKVPHHWAPDLPLHPESSQLDMGGDQYAFLDCRRNAVDGLYFHGRTVFGIVAIGEDKANPKLVFHLAQYKETEMRTWPNCLALAAARSEGDLAAFMHELGAWATERERKRSRSKVNVVWRGELRRDRDLDWNQVLLPASLLDDIRRNVTSFFAMPEFFRNNNIPYKRGFLFAGPPGNGKTLLCRIIASKTPVSFIALTGKDEDMGHELSSAFHEARQLAPSILCIEDMDRLFESAGAKANLGEFLNLMDGMVQPEGVLILATANRPELIDPALTSRPSRFDRVWMIPDPGDAERRRMIEKRLGAFLDAETVARSVKATDGMSMAFVQELCIGASLLAMERGMAGPARAEIEETIQRLKEHIEVAKGWQCAGQTGASALRTSEPVGEVAALATAQGT